MRFAQAVTVVTTLALGVCLPGQLWAETATRAEMEQVCRNWLSYMVHRTGDWAGVSEPSIAGVRELTAGDTLLALCFSINPHGHVVVPILKELPPVKAYSEKCGLDPDQTVGYPQLLRDVLHDRITRFIDRYGGLNAIQPAKGDRLFDRINREEWGRFLVREPRMNSALEGGDFAPLAEVGPLLTTLWHQYEPFNNFCPMGDGDRCVVGCMATAVAQIMKYHEWPVMGRYSHSYYWSGDQSCGGSTPGDTLSADFWDPYDWANMPDSCHYDTVLTGCVPIEENAVAELSYEVGVSLHINYGACGSASGLYEVLSGLPYYFKYRQAIDDEYRAAYTAETWFGLIQTEINAGRPMLYLILGHAIVCDGWRDTGGQNQYHMNYGWGGSYTAWYVLDNLHMSPDPMQEGLVRNIEPAGRFMVEMEADGSGDYPTIQAAVDSSTDGKVILLSDGVYSGVGNRDVDFRGKAIAVRSRNGTPDSCVIDCEGLGRGFLFQSGEGVDSYLEAVTIINGAADNGGAAYCDSSSPTIARCVFHDNSTTQSGGGMYCTHGSSPLLLQCTLSENSTAGQGGGIACDSASAPAVDHTILAFSTAGEAVYCDGGATASLLCCDLYGNAGGNWVGCVAGQYGVNGNIEQDPCFCDAENGDFAIAEDSPCARDNSGSDCGLIGALGVGCVATLVAEVEDAGPLEFGLLTNVPNPFNPVTEIVYSLPGGAERSRVVLCVYNCLGQRVRTLRDGEHSGGVYAVSWDGTDKDGAAVASGVYFCRLSWNGKSQTGRMVLLR